jgi:hypothetical protein
MTFSLVSELGAAGRPNASHSNATARSWIVVSDRARHATCAHID